MKKLFVLSILLTAVITTGCNKMAPGCDNSEVIKTVIDISSSELQRQLNALGKQVDTKKLKFDIDTIRTAETNKDTGSHSCKANLNIKFENNQQQYPITYTVEKAEKGQFYVEVYGLR
ncbi:MAG: hypothetical protein SPF17_00585 [Candidatus Mucispirillum faecigallinarum]|nr:hypothetical protein [Candidatus Mucispirillum faecigallinarum]